MDLLVDYGLLEDDNADIIPLVLLVACPPSKTGGAEIEIYSHTSHD